MIIFTAPEDGSSAYPMKNKNPYEWNWDSTPTADGEYTLTACAFDKAGNSNQASVKITLKNRADEAPQNS